MKHHERKTLKFQLEQQKMQVKESEFLKNFMVMKVECNFKKFDC